MFVCVSTAFICASKRSTEREREAARQRKSVQISFIDGHLVLLQRNRDEVEERLEAGESRVQVVLPFCGIVIKNYDYDERGAQQLKAIQLGGFSCSATMK